MQNYYLTLFRYSAWRFGKLIDFFQRNSQIQDIWYKNEGLYFGSVHATICHILLTDNLWFLRLNNLEEFTSPHNTESYPELTKISITESKIKELYSVDNDT